MRFALAHARDERARDLGAGLVAVRVDDAILRVRRLAAEHEPPVRIEIEVRAGGLQLAHARRPFLDQHLHRRRVAERRARGERVLPVQRRRVAGAERRGDSALRVGGRAVEQRALREQQHVAVLRRAPCGVQSGDAAADDEKASANAIGHAGVKAISDSCGRCRAVAASARQLSRMRKLLILVGVLARRPRCASFCPSRVPRPAAADRRRQRRHRARRRRTGRQVVQRRRLPRRRARREGARRARSASSSPAKAPIARPACACSPPSTWTS